MYVFRPQVAGRTPGGGPSRPTGGHIARQNTKSQRRAQPRSRRRERQPLQQRRRHNLREVVRHLHHRSAIEHGPATGGDAVAREMHIDVREGTQDRTQVRARLQARLVDRRCSELVNCLQRRQGAGWAAYALQGDFNSNEGMRRICEAFGLRPELEDRVLAAARERASGWIKDGEPELHLPIECGDSDSWSPCSAGRSESGTPAAPREHLRPESDIGWSPTPSRPATPGLSPWFVAVPDPDPASDGGLSLPPPEDEQQGQSDSSAGSFLEGAWGRQASSCDEALPGRSTSASALGGTAELAAPPLELGRAARTATRHSPWGSRLLEVTRDPDSVPAAPGSLSDLESPSCDTETQEDAVLRDALVAAIVNADHQRALSEGTPPVVDPGATARRRVSSRRTACVHFADGSFVRFFSLPEVEHTHPSYDRSVFTKAFDGPSGHKASRRGGVPAAAAWALDGGKSPLAGIFDDVDHSQDEDDEDDDEWADRCDDIADLMSQPRHLLMWSSTWM